MPHILATHTSNNSPLLQFSRKLRHDSTPSTPLPTSSTTSSEYFSCSTSSYSFSFLPPHFLGIVTKIAVSPHPPSFGMCMYRTFESLSYLKIPFFFPSFGPWLSLPLPPWMLL
ncbi:hypothetical protein Y032_0001g245 [Ancylostoma ceylanicum]|uniref:Uncharacterized protein n=1 Tax=Ancylostoma ceylanicum TaxID=53326 RepID=A0A016W396_9BILA|nr:hypothetical protein Y032_0001g245 [Ancylostoma ceylanicum]